MNKQAKLQDEIDASNAWELDTKLEIAMDALRTPEAHRRVADHRSQYLPQAKNRGRRIRNPRRTGPFNR